jgi:hypothetical protein
MKAARTLDEAFDLVANRKPFAIIVNAHRIEYQPQDAHTATVRVYGYGTLPNVESLTNALRDMAIFVPRKPAVKIIERDVIEMETKLVKL